MVYKNNKFEYSKFCGFALATATTRISDYVASKVVLILYRYEVKRKAIAYLLVQINILVSKQLDT